MSEEQRKLIIYPTDTVWGIGGPVDLRPESWSGGVGASINRVKKSEENKPLSIAFLNYESLRNHLPGPVVEDIAWDALVPLEFTLLLPKENFNKQLELDLLADISHVGVRFLPFLEGHVSCDKLYSTSLNLSGQPPITKESDAKVWAGEHAPLATFVGLPKHLRPSGLPSTIVSWSEDGRHKLIREGRFVTSVMALINR